MSLLELAAPWLFSPTVVVATVIFAVLYFRGAARVGDPWYKRLSFWFGLALTYAVLHTRFDYYAEREFFMHRLQHIVLHHIGPLFIALAWPGPALRAGLPDAAGRLWDRLWFSPPTRLAMTLLTQPVVAVALYAGLVWLWLIPGIHFYAMLDVNLYRLMNWSMLIDGILFWCVSLDPRPSPPARFKQGTRILMFVAAGPPQVLSGALITFAPYVVYPLYELCGRAFAGVTPMNDQTIGGLILWIPSTMMDMVGALIVLYFWYRSRDDKAST